MSQRNTELILNVVCAILALLFLVSMVTGLYPRLSDFRGWIKVAVNAYGLFCVYRVFVLANLYNVNKLQYIAIISGAISLSQFFVIGNGMRNDLSMGADINPVNSYLWLVIGTMLVIGILKCLCGASFWLPAIRSYLLNDDL